MPLITKPHDYQDDAINDIFNDWYANIFNVLCVAPTGAGKTIIKAFVAKRYLKENPTKTAIIFAHRDVLLCQISIAIASVGIPHRMLCSKATERVIANSHIDELGECFISDNSRLIVASVPTWSKRETKDLQQTVGMWSIDEAHHVLEDNMWGNAVKHMPNALGLGVTATPKRTDKKGLGREFDGIFDTIVETPGMGELIMRGRLSNYKVYTPPDRIDMTGINKTASGEWNQTKLAEATDKPDITGDALEHYRRLANGKQGIIFAASVKHSEHVAAHFKANGVNAVALSSKTKDSIRQQKIKEFRQGKIQILVNYDLFGEGFDVPAVVVVIMLRKTESYALFKQMFGRCLRVLPGKEYGILIDHVGNVERHCSELEHVHDDPEWTLARYTKNKKAPSGNGVLTRSCPKCRFFYLPTSNSPSAFVCPDCGHAESSEEVIAAAKELQIAEGILVEYDTGWLSKIMSDIKKVDESPQRMKARMSHSSAPDVVINSAVKKHKARQKAQKLLRRWIVDWCNENGWKKGLDVATTQGEFNRVFNYNVLIAQTLGSTDAKELTDKIKGEMLANMFNL